MKKITLLIFLVPMLLLVGADWIDYSVYTNFLPSAYGDISTATEVQRAVTCTSIEAMANGLQRCVVEGGSMSSFGGSVDGNSILDVKQVQLINGQLVSAANYVLDIRGTTMAFPESVGVKFSRFNSILVSDSRLTMIGQPITFSSTAFVNLSNTDIVSDSDIVINTSSANLSVADLEANWINIYSPFTDVDAESRLTAVWVRLWNHYPNMAPRLPEGKIVVRSSITAGEKLSIRAETANVSLRGVNSLEVFINSKSVFFGEKYLSGVIGNRSTNFTVIAGAGGFKQDPDWPISGKLISIYSIGDVEINDDLDAFSSATVEKPAVNDVTSAPLPSGKITLAGQGSITIGSSSVLTAEKFVSVPDYRVQFESGGQPSISFLFPNGNVVIRGKLKTYNNPPVYMPGVNSISIEGSNVFMDSNSQAQIDSAHKLTVKAAAITILATPPGSKVHADLADSVPSGQSRMNFTACSSTGIPSVFAGYYHQDISLCGPLRTLNVYGYLANPTGQPRGTGSVRVNSIRLAVPRGPYVLNSTGGNITREVNTIFAPTFNGFFRFTIPAVYISPGDYKINLTFSPVDTFNCTLGGCETRGDILITVPMPVVSKKDGGLTK